MSPNSSALTLVRQFQSETDAIREAPEPRWARITVLVLAGMLVSLIVIMVLTRMDRVITSQAGKIVPTQQVNVFQALDTSIIRSIDVHEGQRVAKGQLLATLDPTFASADVQQLKQQSASLEAQIARDRAELDQQPLDLPESSDPDIRIVCPIAEGVLRATYGTVPGADEQFRRQNPADPGDHRQTKK